MQKKLVDLAVRFRRDESGQGLVEYLLILAMVALATITGMQSAASSVTSAFTAIGSKLGNYIS